MNRKKLAVLLITVSLILSGCKPGGGDDLYNYSTPEPERSDAQTVTADNTEESTSATPDDTENTTPDDEDTSDTEESISDSEETEESGKESESEEETTTSTRASTTTTTTADTTTTTTVATTTTTTAATTTTTAATTTTTTTAATTTQPVNAEPSPPTIYATTADGALASVTEKAVIDYSHTSDGYVMAKYTGSSSKVKVQISYPNGGTYSYDLNAYGNYEAYPLTGGNGSYTVLVAENVSGTAYAAAASCSINVNIANSTAPYLRPSHMVSFSYGDVPVTKASQVCAGASTTLQKIERIYDWVVQNVNYDHAFAATVTSGYVANPAKIINEKKGICYDYAVGIAAMLRSQGIPTQVVFGNVTNVGYHAWVNVYTPESGWVCGVIYFDGTSWRRMDPTIASSNRNNNAIYDFINNNNYYYSIEKLY